MTFNGKRRSCCRLRINRMNFANAGINLERRRTKSIPIFTRSRKSSIVRALVWLARGQTISAHVVRPRLSDTSHLAAFDRKLAGHRHLFMAAHACQSVNLAEQALVSQGAAGVRMACVPA